MPINFRSTPGMMRYAIIYMIGQMQIMGLTVKTADIAAFCNCTKITARKHLNILKKEGRLEKGSTRHRNDIHADVWTLSQSAREEVKKFNVYKNAYAMIVAQKMETL